MTTSIKKFSYLVITISFLFQISSILNYSFIDSKNSTSLNNLSPCKQKLDWYLETLNPLDAGNPFTSTGLGINDLGKYDTCLRADADGLGNLTGTLGYFVYKSYPDLPIYPISYVGFCLPIECMNDEGREYAILRYKNLTINMYNNGDFIMTTDLNNRFAVADAGFIIFIVVLSLILIASIFVRVLPGDRLKKVRISIKNSVVVEKNNISIYSQRGKNDQTTMIPNKIDLTMNVGMMTLNQSKIDPNLSVTVIPGKDRINAEDTNLSQSNSDMKDYTEDNMTFRKISLFAFDYFANLFYIFSFKKHKYTKVTLFEGIRSMSIFLTIINMTCAIMFHSFLVKNFVDVENLKTSVLWHLFTGGNVYINGIFLVSGFFITYKGINRIDTLSKLLAKIALNGLRLWFINLIVFIIYLKVLPFLMTGPLAGYYLNTNIDNCENNGRWASVIFLYSVFTGDGELCMDWSWIIQCEFYFLILGTFTVYLFTKFSSKLYSVLFMVYLILVGIFVKIFLIVDNDLDGFSHINDVLYKSTAYYSKYYRNPFTHIEVYVIGMVFGLIYLKYETYVYLQENFDLDLYGSEKKAAEENNEENNDVNNESNEETNIHKVVSMIRKKCKCRFNII